MRTGLCASRTLPSTAIARNDCRRSVRTRSLAGTDLPGGGQELVQYASEGNLRRLTDLLDGPYSSIEPDDASSKGIRTAQVRTAAQRAMACNQVPALRALLRFGNEHGIDFGFALGTSRLVAVEAAGAGRADILSVLFEEAGISTEVVNGYGRTALLEAAMNGHESTARVAIEAGANVDFITARHGNTAAHLAASNGHIGVLNLLRAAGARLDVERGGDGKTALQLHKELVQKQLATVLRK